MCLARPTDTAAGRLPKGIGEKGESVKGDKGDKGDIGNKGDQGAKAGLRYRFSSVTTAGDPSQGVFRFNNSNATNVSLIYIDILDINFFDMNGVYEIRWTIFALPVIIIFNPPYFIKSPPF